MCIYIYIYIMCVCVKLRVCVYVLTRTYIPDVFVWGIVRKVASEQFFRLASPEQDLAHSIICKVYAYLHGDSSSKCLL